MEYKYSAGKSSSLDIDIHIVDGVVGRLYVCFGALLRNKQYMLKIEIFNFEKNPILEKCICYDNFYIMFNIYIKMYIINT